MNLLLTGAIKYTKKQLNDIKALGYNITFVQDERIPLEIDCSAFDAAVCNGLFLYTSVEKFTNLKLVQLTSAGLDRAPVEYFKKKNIQLYNARGVYSVPMAEWVILKTLEIYKMSKLFFNQQNKHFWNKQRDIIELSGKTVCVLGTGSVGLECLKRFAAFGTINIGVDIINPDSSYIDEFFYMGKLDTALSKSDIVVLTLPLLDSTRGVFNKERINAMKSTAVLINVSRGGVVNEADLSEALKEKRISAAALDVFEEEPLDSENPLWNMDNVIITPHNSFISDNNSERLFNVIYGNLKNFKNNYKG